MTVVQRLSERNYPGSYREIICRPSIKDERLCRRSLPHPLSNKYSYEIAVACGETRRFPCALTYLTTASVRELT